MRDLDQQRLVIFREGHGDHLLQAEPRPDRLLHWRLGRIGIVDLDFHNAAFPCFINELRNIGPGKADFFGDMLLAPVVLVIHARHLHEQVCL